MPSLDECSTWVQRHEESDRVNFPWVMSSSEESTWRFSMELLPHVHTLRVFLFPSSLQVRPAQDCTSLQATLLSAPPALCCSWRTAHHDAAYSLCLSLPVLLFDYSSSPHISASADCIQLTLHLLPLPSLLLHAFSSLPLDVIAFSHAPGAGHTGIYSECDALSDFKSAQCEDGDVAHQMGGTQESLRSENDTCYDYAVHSPELDCTQTIALSRDIDLHGVGRSDAENIFMHEIPQSPPLGARGESYGCISNLDYANNSIDGGIAQESLACNGAHYEMGHIASPVSNNGAVDIIGTSRKDISENAVKVSPNGIRSHGNSGNLGQFTAEPSFCFQKESKVHRCPAQCIGGAVEASQNQSVCPHVQVAHNLRSKCDDFARQNFSILQGSQHGATFFFCKSCLAKVSSKPVREFVQLPCFDWREVAENWFGACCCSFGSAAEALSVGFEKSLQLRAGKCLVGPSTFYVDFCDVIISEELGLSSKETNMRQFTTPYFLAFGDGFMVWENQQSKVIEWLPVRCKSCVSLIGAYPHASEGLHLFRCQVITCNADGTFNDTYRLKTFKDLLVKELRLRSNENTTYRFLVRSLSSKIPLLQMVVLNYDALICTGRVNARVKENPLCMNKITGVLSKAGLQQSIKVLFLDCSRCAGDDVRSAELWVQEHDGETMFMLEELVDRLRDELFANSMFCPVNCGLFQGFRSSFLYMMQD